MNALLWFRRTAWWEGISYLALLFVAMPLKYLAGLPLAVRVVGALHGALFLAFVALLGWVAVRHAWSMRRCAWAFLLSLVPFGTFLLERQLRAEAGEEALDGFRS